MRVEAELLTNAIEAVLNLHAPRPLRHGGGYACAVDYDVPWPCATRIELDRALALLLELP
jgi:hypothetical protein